MCRAMICKGSPRLSILRLWASSANRSNFRALRGSGMATQAGEKMRVRGGGFLEVPPREAIAAIDLLGGWDALVTAARNDFRNR